MTREQKEQKIDAAIAFLLEQPGVRPVEVYPWEYKILRKLGVLVPPPLFVPLKYYAAIMGVLFAIIMQAFTYFWDEIQYFSWNKFVVKALISGVLIGLFMYYRRKKLNIPKWEDFQYE